MATVGIKGLTFSANCCSILQRFQ